MSPSIPEENLTRQGWDIVLTPRGELTVSDALEFRALLIKNIEMGFHKIVVDLKDVAAIDSIGMGALVEAGCRLNEYDGELVVTRPQGSVKYLVNLMKVPRVVEPWGVLDTVGMPGNEVGAD